VIKIAMIKISQPCRLLCYIIITFLKTLQCYNTVGWVTGRASGI